MTERNPPEDRAEPSYVAPEREMLDGWLDYHRRTLLWKCEGLGDDQLTTASVPPSALTLLGLVRHMAEVERGWFAPFVGTDDSDIYCTPDAPDADFEVAGADVAADLATFRREVDTYREGVRQLSLDHTIVRGHGHAEESERHGLSLRWVYTHMIEEYARHNGHADLIREAIDGATGD